MRPLICSCAECQPNRFKPEDAASTSPFDGYSATDLLAKFRPSEAESVTLHVGMPARIAELEQALRDLIAKCRDEKQFEKPHQQDAWRRAARLVER